MPARRRPCSCYVKLNRRRQRRHQSGSAASLSHVRTSLIRWWQSSGRTFPWRSTIDPFRILVAETFLHRTRAQQVEPVYVSFVRRFRSWRAVAKASPQDLAAVLGPLGLRWRVRRFHEMASMIVRRFEGRTPTERDDLEALPGVGHYKTSAVRCFALGVPEILLDTNTVRILGRLRNLRVSDASRRSALFRAEMGSILDIRRPREFNWALLDLGALICRPKSPRCRECPICACCAFGRRRRHQVRERSRSAVPAPRR